MKKVGIIIFAVALLIGLVCSNFFSFGKAKEGFFDFSFFTGVSGSGNSVTEKRDLSGFKAVEVGGVFKVEITAQKDFSVEVEADDNLLPLIRTEVRGGILTIESEKRINSHNPILVRISAPDIESLESSGAPNVSINNIKNSAFAVNSSGASKVTVEGESSKLTVDVSGASNINADNLKAGDANIEASGASHVYVNVSGELRSDGSGASKIVYSGTPKKVEKRTSGASSVSPK
jgi:Putative auto-transporter adhesin, head GIN domain